MNMKPGGEARCWKHCLYQSAALLLCALLLLAHCLYTWISTAGSAVEVRCRVYGNIPALLIAHLPSAEAAMAASSLLTACWVQRLNI